MRRFLPIEDSEVGGEELTFEQMSAGKKRKKDPTPASNRASFAMTKKRPVEKLKPAQLLVVGHAKMFEAVYGVEPSDVADNYAQAVSAARGLLHAFDDDAERAMEYLKWVWRRDARNKKWVEREKNESKTPPSWRRFFSARDLVDAYRAEALRKAKDK